MRGGRAGTRRAGCAAISGLVFSDRFATPFLSLSTQQQRAPRVRVSRARSFSPFASSSQPSSVQAPLASNFVLECDRDTRARDERTRREALRCTAQSTAEQSEAERSGAERGETDFQMDINSSACSTPRSSLITPLQLLSLIKASSPVGA